MSYDRQGSTQLSTHTNPSVIPSRRISSRTRSSFESAELARYFTLRPAAAAVCSIDAFSAAVSSKPSDLKCLSITCRSNNQLIIILVTASDRKVPRNRIRSQPLSTPTIFRSCFVINCLMASFFLKEDGVVINHQPNGKRRLLSFGCGRRPRQELCVSVVIFTSSSCSTACIFCRCRTGRDRCGRRGVRGYGSVRASGWPRCRRSPLAAGVQCRWRQEHLL